MYQTQVELSMERLEMTAWRKTNGLCKIEMPVEAMGLKK
jgi:hypothetical protein